MIYEKPCKSALTKSKLPGLTYSLNPYVGCQHACRYCYVPSLFHKSRIDWSTTVSAKINIPILLSQEIRKKKEGVVGISTVTDAYQPAEERYQLTRKCLNILSQHKWPVDILTKSDLVTRDFDVLRKCSKVKIGFTIPTLNEEFRERLEPNAPSISRRLSALKKCAKHGFLTYVFCGPLIKKMRYDEVREYVGVMADTGAQEIILDTLHLKPGVWESVISVLSEDERKILATQYNQSIQNDMIESFQNICRKRITFTRAFA